MSNSRVFFPIKSPHFDMSDAERFGKPVYLFESERPNALDLEGSLDTICEKLEVYRFDSQEDYIALTGPMIFVSLIVLAAYLLSNSGSVNFLVYDAVKHQYTLSSLSIEETETQET